MTDTQPPREGAAGTAQMVDPRMLESLVCPVSQSVLSYDAAAQELVSKVARLAFPIRNGIPVMLVSEARTLE
ncbi:Trm112 family protein [Pseudotabrizicola sp.]|uniref:Trm112 family protein n=1 Tax=Pseudotabrizicola sp. TaxID=2939647 RepID=UPI00351EA595